MPFVRSPSSLSNQAVQNTAAYNHEEKKLQNYTEISSTLSKISTSAAKAVAPTLAGVIANRATYKERVDNDFKALGCLWENIFDVFAQSVAGAIDGGLQNALMTLKKEGDNVVDKVMASRSGSLKRKSGVSESLSSNEKGRGGGLFKEPASASSQSYDDEGQDPCKRRRLASSPLENHQNEEDVVFKLEDVDTSVMTMLQEIKLKMDRQTQTVEMLTQENKQV